MSTSFEIGTTLATAAQRLSEVRVPLVRALLLPVCALAAVEVAIARVEFNLAVTLGYFAVYTLLYSVFAVSCHRIILLGASTLPNSWSLYFTTRELRFFGWSLSLAVVAGTAILAIGLPLMFLAAQLGVSSSAWVVSIGLVPAAVVSLYVLSRASLVLPATAIDQHPNLVRAWQLSQGNGWRLSVCYAIPLAAIFSLGGLSAWFSPNNGLSYSIFSSVLLVASFVLEVSVLSMAYRALVRSPRSTAA